MRIEGGGRRVGEWLVLCILFRKREPAVELVGFRIEARNADGDVLADGIVPNLATDRSIRCNVFSASWQYRRIRVNNRLARVGGCVPLDNAGTAPVEQIQISVVDAFRAVPYVRFRR